MMDLLLSLYVTVPDLLPVAVSDCAGDVGVAVRDSSGLVSVNVKDGSGLVAVAVRDDAGLVDRWTYMMV